MFQALDDNDCVRPQIKLVDCKEYKSGGFDSKTNEIEICKNYIQDNMQLQETITHELVHAYDTCLSKPQGLDCLFLACTEIRAAHLSGDCDMLTEFKRGNFPNLKECVKRRSKLAIQDKCPVQLIDMMFESCFNNKDPFE
ncbi:Mitochondrial inner membrane protease ATP23 [Boothiomyces sp. JEL0866]|nr:Mitochondrial inner membrane protease ATP23 [Boothiomyces sp. JEL0866]